MDTRASHLLNPWMQTVLDKTQILRTVGRLAETKSNVVVPVAVRRGASGTGSSVDELLLATEETYESTQIPEPPPEELLGTGQVIWDRLTGWITGVGKDEALRKALQDWLKDDKTFDRSNEDETYQAVTASVGNDIDFIITGHTHLDRAIKMSGDRHYFNCGTWIRFLRFTDAMLKDKQSFKPYFDVLEDGRMAAIDNTQQMTHPLLLDQTSAVCIKIKDNRTIGELAHINDNKTDPRDIVFTS